MIGGSVKPTHVARGIWQCCSCLLLLFSKNVAWADVMIHEIMRNPTKANDTHGEWFELYNNGTRTVNLFNWTLGDDVSDRIRIRSNLLIEPRGYLVLGTSNNTNLNGRLVLDYVYSNQRMTFRNCDQLVMFNARGRRIDRVDWSREDGSMFPRRSGVSIALRSPNHKNNIGSSWCLSSTRYGRGDYGTPGTANDCRSGGFPTTPVTSPMKVPIQVPVKPQVKLPVTAPINIPVSAPAVPIAPVAPVTPVATVVPVAPVAPFAPVPVSQLVPPTPVASSPITPPITSPTVPVSIPVPMPVMVPTAPAQVPTTPAVPTVSSPVVPPPSAALPTLPSAPMVIGPTVSAPVSSPQSPGNNTATVLLDARNWTLAFRAPEASRVPTVEESNELLRRTIGYMKSYAIEYYASNRELKLLDMNATLGNTLFGAGIPATRFTILMNFTSFQFRYEHMVPIARVPDLITARQFTVAAIIRVAYSRLVQNYTNTPFESSFEFELST